MKTFMRYASNFFPALIRLILLLIVYMFILSCGFLLDANDSLVIPTLNDLAQFLGEISMTKLVEQKFWAER